jgi:iron complex transport system substrate-binding protein
MSRDPIRRSGCKLGILFALCIHTLYLITPTAAYSQYSAVDGRGIKVTLTAPPKRIISLAPSNTEILFALGLKGRIIADTSQCNYPPEASMLQHIGDYRISVEQVVALKPDLVVAVTSANRSAIEQLLRLKVPLFAVDPSTIRETYDAIRRIGRITDTDHRASEIVAGMEARANAIEHRVASQKNKPKVLIVVQSQPLMVAGSKTFMDEIVAAAGGVNVGRSSGSGYNLFSPEKAVVDAPDLIIGTTDLRSKPGWSNIPAVRNHRILLPPPDVFSRPGPRLIDALEFMARALRPESFNGKPASNGSFGTGKR